MRTGRPKQPLTGEPTDQEKLELLARRPKTAQHVARRSKILLRAAEGFRNQEMACRLGMTGATGGSGTGCRQWRVGPLIRTLAPRQDHRCQGGGSRHSDSAKSAF